MLGDHKHQLEDPRLISRIRILVDGGSEDGVCVATVATDMSLVYMESVTVSNSNLTAALCHNTYTQKSLFTINIFFHSVNFKVLSLPLTVIASCGLKIPGSSSHAIRQQISVLTTPNANNGKGDRSDDERW